MACVVRGIVRAPEGTADPSGDETKRRLGRLGIVAEDRVVPILALLDEASAPVSWRSMDPRGRLSRTVDAVTALVAAAAGERPQIIVLEDLHWADSEARALVAALAASIASSAVLVLATLRDYHNGLTLAPGSHVGECALRQFTAPESEQFLAELMGPDPALGGLKARLVRKTQGNPFFLEESVRALRDTGALSGRPGALTPAHDAVEFKVPDSIRAVIAERIDVLPDAERSLLFHAAVLGQGFDIAILRHFAGLSREQLFIQLEQLQSAGFVQRTRVVPNMEYSFRHALIHDVAYETLLRRRRRELHARAMGVIRRRPRDRVHGRTQLLAHHAAAAGEAAAAYVYGRAAGLEAQAKSRNQEARDHLANALAGLEKCRPTLRARHAAVDLRLEFAQSLFSLGQTEPAQPQLDEAQKRAEELGDQRRLSKVLSNRTLHYWIGGQLTHAIDSEKAALHIARDQGDNEQTLSSTVRLGLIMTDRGDYRAASILLARTSAKFSQDSLHRRFGQLSPAAVAGLASLALCYGEMGRFRDAIEFGDRAISIANDSGHGFSRVYAYLHVGMALLRKGDVSAAPLLERALSLGEETHSDLLVPTCRAALGYAYTQAEGREEGLSLLAEAVSDFEQRAVGRALAMTWSARANLAAGRREQAAELASQALALAEKHEERAQKAWAMCVLGEAYLTAGRDRLAKAEGLFRRARETALARAMQPLEAHCLHGLARLHSRIGQLEIARREFADAVRRFDQLGMDPWLTVARHQQAHTRQDLLARSDQAPAA